MQDKQYIQYYKENAHLSEKIVLIVSSVYLIIRGVLNLFEFPFYFPAAYSESHPFYNMGFGLNFALVMGTLWALFIIGALVYVLISKNWIAALSVLVVNFAKWILTAYVNVIVQNGDVMELMSSMGVSLIGASVITGGYICFTLSLKRRHDMYQYRLRGETVDLEAKEKRIILLAKIALVVIGLFVVLSVLIILFLIFGAISMMGTSLENNSLLY